MSEYESTPSLLHLKALLTTQLWTDEMVQERHAALHTNTDASSQM